MINIIAQATEVPAASQPTSQPTSAPVIVQKVIEVGEQVTESVNEFMAGQVVFNNNLWQWMGFGGLVLLALVAGKILSWIFKRQAGRLAERKGFQATEMILSGLRGPIRLIAIAGAFYVASCFMTFSWVEKNNAGEMITKTILPFWMSISHMFSVIAAGWFVYKIVDVVEHFLTRLTGKTETTLDDQIVPIIRKALRLVVLIATGLFLAQNIFQWNVSSLLAGLGIGGLAFAFAAKDMLSNLFGSATIFTDRPFKMGDRVEVAGHNGTVEEVGFRSTKIRTLTGTLITIPNSIFANSPIENISRRPTLKRVLNIGLTYDTSPEKMDRAVEILREMLDARKKYFSEENDSQVFFTDFNADNLNIVIYYWFTPPDWWDYLKFNHEFNLELLKRFNEEKLEFAFPTQTIYMKKETL